MLQLLVAFAGAQAGGMGAIIALLYLPSKAW